MRHYKPFYLLANNLLMNKSSSFILIILIIIAGISSWWRWSPKTDDTHTPEQSGISSDYFLESFIIREMNIEGQPHFILKGERLDYYQKTGHSTIKNPSIAFNPEDSLNDQTAWTINAGTAETRSEDFEQLHFQQNVKINRPASEQQSALMIETQSMLIQPEIEIAESNSQTTITMGNTEIQASNMRINIKSGLIDLSNIKSRIELK
jgi:LPS export ABC transporter protein LptC